MEVRPLFLFSSSLVNLYIVPRAGGKGEIYTYIPLLDHNTERLLVIPPESHKNPDYGFSVGRGAWKFSKGTWTTIAERVKLNGIGEADGEVQLWIDGVSVIHATGLILREDMEAHIKGLHFQTFFGGGSSIIFFYILTVINAWLVFSSSPWVLISPTLDSLLTGYPRFCRQ